MWYNQLNLGWDICTTCCDLLVLFPVKQRVRKLDGGKFVQYSRHEVKRLSKSRKLCIFLWRRVRAGSDVQELVQQLKGGNVILESMLGENSGFHLYQGRDKPKKKLLLLIIHLNNSYRQTCKYLSISITIFWFPFNKKESSISPFTISMPSRGECTSDFPSASCPVRASMWNSTVSTRP